VVDITGELPVILMDLNLTDSSLKNKYIYADRQILAQHDIDEGEEEDFKYFYLHDRLGSVRLVIDDQGAVKNTYTYEPFGEMFATECTETTESPFKFTGQWFDDEIEEYYLRARQYNPHLARFTSRDPVAGQFEQPLTLHRYLYCGNDSANRVDLDGRWALAIGGSVTLNLGGAGSALISQTVKTYGLIAGGLVRNAIFANLADIAYSTAGTAGISSVIGKGKDGWFYGSMYYVAGGVQGGDFLAGVAADYAISFEAEKLQDLAGYFIEVGCSGGPLARFGMATSRSVGTNIRLHTGTISAGWGTVEAHAFVGHTWVEEW
jgi:RHS repeat-associated protein